MDLFEQLDQYAEEEEEKSKQDKHAIKLDRVSKCGKPHEYIDPKTGRLVEGTFICNYPDLCSHCKTRRSEKTKAKVFIASRDGLVKTLTITDRKEATKLKKKLESEGVKCLQLPQPDGTEYLIHNGNSSTPGEEKHIDDIQWEQVTDTPKGRNISGKMGTVRVSSAPKEEKTGPMKRVKINSYAVTNVTPEAKQFCWELAVLKTAGFRPDLENIYICLRERTRVYHECLRELTQADVKFFVWDFIAVYEDEIKWEEYSTTIQKKLNRQGIYDSDQVSKLPTEYLETQSEEVKTLEEALYA